MTNISILTPFLMEPMNECMIFTPVTKIILLKNKKYITICFGFTPFILMRIHILSTASLLIALLCLGSVTSTHDYTPPK